ncbi:MAG TPA: protease modulator HflK, partial [Nevskiaceae bacterium]|nr:protease modulator HflK [Nevskiaceae bacterium]
AARFSALVAEYRKAPQVTRDRLYLDSMSDVMTGSSKILVDVDKGNPMFYFPLDQLLKNAPHGDAYTSDYAASAGVPSRSGVDPSRSRDRGRP